MVEQEEEDVVAVEADLEELQEDEAALPLAEKNKECARSLGSMYLVTAKVPQTKLNKQ